MQQLFFLNFRIFHKIFTQKLQPSISNCSPVNHLIVIQKDELTDKLSYGVALIHKKYNTQGQKNRDGRKCLNMHPFKPTFQKRVKYVFVQKNAKFLLKKRSMYIII